MARKKPSNTEPEQSPAAAPAERYFVSSAARRSGLLARLVLNANDWTLLDQAPSACGPSPLIVLDEVSVTNVCAVARRVIASLGARVLIVCETADSSRVLELVRSGASDVLLPTDTPETAKQRIDAALACCGEKDEALRRAAALRDELVGQLTSLCGELGAACRDLAGNMQHVALASEMTALIRQELDLESLLRTVLEFMLKRTGPTNAAVFLPSNGGDYTLGAYANYDCPKDSAEIMFDELAGVIGPRFEHTTAISSITGSADLRRWLGEAAHWIEESNLVVIPCREGGECRAVIALFRDRRAAFNEATLRVLTLMAGLISQQLGRVVRTHNRHLPKNKWASPGESASGDDIDLAA